MVTRRRVIPSRELTELTFQKATTAYLRWAEDHCTEAFRRSRERILRQDVQPILGELPLLLVNSKLFELVKDLGDSPEGRRLSVIINSANLVMDWIVPRLRDRPLRITLGSMQRTLKDFLHSQKRRLQIQKWSVA
jgi:hypothetical protein